MTTISTERLYALKVYHRAADKPECPACGHKHRFSEYVNLKTGLPVGPGVGKCDRINHCGYRVTPQEYFKQHPEARYGYHAQATPLFRPAEDKPRLYLPDNIIEQYATPYIDSTFGRWLARKAPSAEALQQVAADYHLTATQTRGIIFWYIDECGRYCQGKMMWYDLHGHRNGCVSTVSSDLAKQGLLPANAEMQRCLFGAHLLISRPADLVYIVESEKTAVVMAMLHPEYVWLATGGCSNLNTYVVRPLFNRRVILIPDSGCLDKWRKVMAQTKSIQYSFCEDLEQYPANTDLLDICYPGE